MPIYEYKCRSCEEVFSELRSIAEREQPIACPKCGSDGEIVFSTFARGGQTGISDNVCPMDNACPGGT